MFVLILVCLLYVSVDFEHKHAKEPPKSTETYTRHTKINTNIQKTHQNQQKHTKDPPKSTQTMFMLNLVVLLYVFVDFGGSFVCLC
jgi:uncharacterized ion transporter superfamily protein YfcC